MSKKNLENNKIEELIETQEESEEDDEVIFRLVVNAEIVSWAKTILYSHLKEIHTAIGEKRKGYAGELLSRIEKIAEKHGAFAMTAFSADSESDESFYFFRSMGYVLIPVEDSRPTFQRHKK